MSTIRLTRSVLRQSCDLRVFKIKIRYNSISTLPTKLTSSYFHHASTLPLVNKTLGQSFDEITTKYPDHECFIFKNENKRYTYKSFKDQVDSMAASLLELGFEKGDRLAVWLPNTLENTIISLVTSKLGLIKVNINPAYVERELTYCINKVGCNGIIIPRSVKTIDTLAMFRRLVPELDHHRSSFDQLSFKAVPSLKHIILTGDEISIPGIHSFNKLIERGAKIPFEKVLQRQASIDPDSPCSIFYTSGTTGQPKAATLTNFGLLNLLYGQWENIGQFLTRTCVPIPMFHIFAETVGILNVVIQKCQSVFPAILPDTVATMRAIQEEKCTALIGSPVIFRDILMHPDKKKYDLSSLELGVLGASPMQPDFLRRLEIELPVTRVTQGYGMTENGAIFASAYWAGDADQQRRHSSMGLCMQRLEVKVADKEGNPVPIGQQGEIWTRGFSMMKGYYNDPDKTRETMTTSGWLKTGDEGKMDEKGFLYYVGRQKEMIIRGGVNIYPVEIENVIVEHPNVAEAQVFGIPDERYGEEVCAWIKLKPDMPKCTTDDVINFLKNKLAFFKIPKHIRIVDKFIMTPTGKVQKYKLSEVMVNEIKQANKQ